MFIAEIGNNHGGDINTALKMIKSANVELMEQTQ